VLGPVRFVVIEDHDYPFVVGEGRRANCPSHSLQKLRNLILVGRLGQTEHTEGQLVAYGPHYGDPLAAVLVQVHPYRLLFGAPSIALAHPHVAAAFVEVDDVLALLHPSGQVHHEPLYVY
jgi:hypothetical protein